MRVREVPAAQAISPVSSNEYHVEPHAQWIGNSSVRMGTVSPQTGHLKTVPKRIVLLIRKWMILLCNLLETTGRPDTSSSRR